KSEQDYVQESVCESRQGFQHSHRDIQSSSFWRLSVLLFHADWGDNVQSPSSVGNLSTYMTTLRKGTTVYVTHNRGRSWANSASNTIVFGGSLLM
ncbi:hypothetical protein M9458_024818, partial [Cirrhinus mrigala]